MDTVTIAFVSGKGGTGTTAAAILTGSALAALGKNVLYIELKTALRTADIIAGIAGKVVYDISDVLLGRCPLEKAVVQSQRQPGLWLICAPHEDGFWGKKQLMRVLASCQKQYDYILIDTPSGLDEGFALGTEAADRAVLVLTPDPISLRIGRLLCEQPELEHTHVRFLLNRVIPQRTLAGGVLDDLDEAIDLVGVQLLGVIPDSPLLQVACTGGRPLPARCTEQAIFTAIAKRLMGEDIPLVYK